MLATPNFVRRLIVVGAAALFMLLLSGSQTEAGGRPMRAWTRLMFGFERVCKDGMRLAMADTDRHTYKLVFVEKGQRRILVNYAKRQVGKKAYGGQSSHLPLKINMAGVISPNFVSRIILYSSFISRQIARERC